MFKVLHCFHISIWNLCFFFHKWKKNPVVSLRKYWAITTDKKKYLNSILWENCWNCLQKLYFAIVKDKSFCISHSCETKSSTRLCLIIFYCFSTQIWIQRLIFLNFCPIKSLEFYSNLATFSISGNTKFSIPRIDACLSMTKHFLFIFFQRTKSRS